MKFLALKDLPNGIEAGQEFDEHEDVGDVLILVGAAKKVEAPIVQYRPNARRSYARKDLDAA